MGSKMAKDCWDDPLVDLPQEGNPVVFFVIQKGYCILADKGFTSISRSFPNSNEIDTPTPRGGRKNGRYVCAEILFANFAIHAKPTLPRLQRRDF